MSGSLHRRLGAAVVAILLFATSLYAGPAQPVRATHGSLSYADRLGADLAAILHEQRVAMNIPGVTATVIFADGSRWSGTSGTSVLTPRAPAATHTPFVVGSITKTFVAALILRLAEEGALSLDDPLSRWLPGHRNATGLSLRQLLSHTSGVANHFEHPAYGRLVFNRPTYSWAAQEILDTFARRPSFAPGTEYRYSNTNYVLLGMVAERAGGRLLGEQLRAHFGGPLGLTRTYFQGDGPPPASSATGYLWTTSGFKAISDGTGYRPTRSAATVAWAAGDSVSTADDIATWARALYGGSVLAPESLAQMLDYAAYPRAMYGLGVMTRRLDGRRMLGHTGSLRGYVAAMWHLPAENTTVAVTTNRGRINPHRIANALLRRVLTDDAARPGQRSTNCARDSCGGKGAPKYSVLRRILPPSNS